MSTKISPKSTKSMKKFPIRRAFHIQNTVVFSTNRATFCFFLKYLEKNNQHFPIQERHNNNGHYRKCLAEKCGAYALALADFMEISQEHNRQIEQIIGEMECPKDFACYDSGFENLGRIKLIAGGEKVECLADNRLRCKFALHYGLLTICECPLRNYIARHFRKS